MQNLRALAAVFGLTLSSWATYGDIIDDLREKVGAVPFHGTAFEVQEEDTIHFKEDAESLASGRMHMSAQVMKSSELQKEFPEFDHDGLSRVVKGKKDRVMVAKTVALIRHAEPNYFTAEQVTKDDYMDASMADSTNTLLDAKKHTVKQSQSYGGGMVTIKNTITFTDVNADQMRGSSQESQTIKALRDLASSRLPDHVYTNHSGPRDVNRGSYGGRSFHMYYNIDSDHTLYVSYKLVTMQYESLFYLYWSRVLGQAASRLIEGTQKSVQRIQAYIDSSPKTEL